MNLKLKILSDPETFGLDAIDTNNLEASEERKWLL